MNSSRTTKFTLFVDLAPGDPRLEQVTEALDHLVECVRTEGINCYSVESDCPRPKDFDR